MNPLVVTLLLDDDVQAGLDAQRERWFPPGRTVIGAHVTLFHAVPGELQEQVEADLTAAGGPAFAIRLDHVMSLGRGAAYAIESPELGRRHAALQQAWWPHLTRQDQQGFRPHVTIANKLDPAGAREVLESLRATFTPSEISALGYRLWRYEGGSWTPLATVPFR